MSYKLILPANYERQPLPRMSEWVEKLRSGAYKQGGGYLKKDDRYCCLGVLCELNESLTPGFRDGIFKDGESGANFGTLSDKNSYYDIFGAHGCFPEGVYVLVNGSHQLSLAEVNDSAVDFEGIADIIEAVWK